MHTVKVPLTLAEASLYEEKLLELANELGRPLNFSLLVLPASALLTGYFRDRLQSLGQLKMLGLESRAQHGYLRSRDWRDSVKEHFKPLIYRHVAWVPSWQKGFKNKSVKTTIRLDIGMAFGTGNHPTTRLCLRRLVEALAKFSKTNQKFNKKLKPSVSDIGCGSGILAVTAERLGAMPVTGFDLDEHSITVARRNAKMNRSKAKFTVQDLYKTKLPQADIVLANLLANLIEDNAKKLWASVKPGGTLILSGLLKTELTTISKLFPVKAKSTKLGIWGVLVLNKP